MHRYIKRMLPYRAYVSYNGTLDKFNTSAVFEIALVRLSETSDYLLGQVNNPSVGQVKVTTIFYLPLKLQQSVPQLMTHRRNTAKITPT